MTPSSQVPIMNPEGDRIDPETGLPLPDPFPDYIPCPHCGEKEVEVWCFQAGGVCHQCGGWVDYPKPTFCGVAPYCQRGEKNEEEDGPPKPATQQSQLD